MSTSTLPAIDDLLRAERTLTTLWIRDRRSAAEHTFYMGEFQVFWSSQATFGRDAGCTIVLDAPEIAPVHFTTEAHSNHRYIRLLASLPAPEGDDARADGFPAADPLRVDYREFVVGPFTLCFGENTWRGDAMSFGGPVPAGAAFAQPRPPTAPEPPPPRMGPHTEALRAWLAALPAARWLRPDADLEALRDEARQWVAARLDECVARAGAAEAGAAVGRVHFARGLRRFLHCYAAAWDFDAWAHVERTQVVRRICAQYVGGRDDYLGNELCRRAGAPATGGDAPWTRQVGPAIWGRAHTEDLGRRLPALGIALRVVRRITRHGLEQAAVAPESALLDVWNRGAWPVALPDGAWLVWVPVRQGDGLVLEPGDALEPEPAPPGPAPSVPWQPPQGALGVRKLYTGAETVMLV